MDTRWIALASLLIFAPACGDDGSGLDDEDGSSTGDVEAQECPPFPNIFRGELAGGLMGEVTLNYNATTTCEFALSIVDPRSSDGLELNDGQATALALDEDGAFSASFDVDEDGLTTRWTVSGVVTETSASGDWSSSFSAGTMSGTWSAAPSAE